MSAAAWDSVTPLLADRFNVIAPTAAGHRGGELLPGKATIRALVDTTERLLDEHRLAAVHIAGNSMGGWIGIELARRGRALSMCAFSPAGLWAAHSTHNQSRNTLRRTKKLAGVTRHITPHFLRFGPARRVALATIAVHGERLPFKQAVRTFNDLVDCHAAEDLLTTDEYLAPLESAPCPITVAWSAQDRIFPPARFMDTARQRLPHARFVVLPNVGHVPMIDHPALCARTIIDSISRSASDQADDRAL